MLATNIPEVISQLDEIIDKAQKEGSPHGYFAALYRLVTRRVLDRIEEGDYFDDNVRMEHLDVVFANRYLQAYNTFVEQGDCGVRTWQLAFDSVSNDRLVVMQHLLLGMNAHIGLDLGAAAAAVSEDGDIEDLRADFMRINELLAAEVDAVQRAIAQFTPLLRVLDWVGGKLDEAVAQFSMDVARDASWQMAVDLSTIGEKQLRSNFLAQRDQQVAGFSRRLQAPKAPFRFLVRLFLWMEKGDVTERIGMLRQI